jgi:uncharacterized protein (TIGR02996 family)
MAKKRATPRTKKAQGRTPAAQEQAFLRAVLDEPDDDTHRLVYADWLDENGRPERAEFIRLQIERARRPLHDPARAVPGERESALLQAQNEEWLWILSEAKRRWGTYLAFERGFPAGVHVQIADFITWDDGPWQAAPMTDLYLHDITADTGDVLPDEERERIVRTLADMPQLARLRGLHIVESGFRLQDLERLRTSPHLTRLRYLNLGDNYLGDEVVRMLADNTALPSLTGVNLEANQVSDVGAAQLADTAFLERLTDLGLGNSNLTDAGVERLAESPQMGNLEYLTLLCNPIGDASARALAASPHLGNLRGLWLMATEIGPAGQAALRQRFGERVRF